MRYLLAALCACSSPAERGPPPPVEPSQVEPPPPRDPLAEVTGDALDPVPEGDLLWVFDDGIYEERGGTRTSIVGLARGVLDPSDVSEGGDGFLVPDLQRSIAAWAPRSPALVLGVAPQVPTRTLSRVIYTAIQGWDGSHYWLVVRQRDESRAIRVTVPRLESPEALLLGALGEEGAFEDVLSGDLNILVGGEGLIVAGAGAKLRPGCRDTAIGRVVAVPLRDGAQDWAELGRCLARVKEQFPSETTVIVSADPNIPFADVANAMVAARGSTARPLFPAIMYSAGVR
jgi:hypothetical protein